jgi:hypothetical protein
MQNKKKTFKMTEAMLDMPCWMVSELICNAAQNEEAEYIDESNWICSPFISIEQWIDAGDYVGGFVAVDAPYGMPDIYIHNGFSAVWAGKATEKMMETGYLGEDFMSESLVKDIIEMNGIQEQVERETNEFGTRLNGKWW